MGRVYVYWTPHEWAALNAEYLFERFKESSESNLGTQDVKTHRVPLGVNFFHPCGASAVFKATHVRQDGSFSTIADASNFTPGEDRFWLVDASIGYRLPKRFGIVSVGARNLFDKSFRFFDTDFVSPAIQPARMFFARLTLSI